MLVPQTPSRSRMGCLTRLLLVLLLGIALVLAIDVIFAPWSFFMGGNFHWFPMWQGWGRMHSSAGDYALFVRMEPRPGSRGVAHVSGRLCFALLMVKPSISLSVATSKNTWEQAQMA